MSQLDAFRLNFCIYENFDYRNWTKSGKHTVFFNQHNLFRQIRRNLDVVNVYKYLGYYFGLAKGAKTDTEQGDVLF